MASTKAYKIEEIDQAVQFNEPIGPNHPFYTNFSDLRGGFKERYIYNYLNVKKKSGTYYFNDKVNSHNKSLLFLGGMRGTGKTSELARYAYSLNHSQCFLCVTCNIDAELDMNDVEYMDILIFQLEKLTAILKDKNIKVDNGIVQRMEKWFSERSKEINTSLQGELGLEVGIGVGDNSLISKLLGVLGAFKLGVTGSKERTTTVRQTMKNRFSTFADIFNLYIEEVNYALRNEKVAREVLFIIDGLEKTMSVETRRKIIMEESMRLQKIKAYTIFTLPIELMKESQILGQFSNVASFPFVKLINRDGSRVEKAFDRFVEFVYKRIDANLFENEAIVKKAIYYSGGSPRELLRILESALLELDEEKEQIDGLALDTALQRLANQTARYLTQDMLDKLVEIKQQNDKMRDTPFDETIQSMLERILVMEYNSGQYKRPNPILELSNLYQQSVESAN